MTFRVERTALRTMTAATDSVTTGKIHGKILSVKIVTSASNTFNVYTDGSPVTEYLIGASGAPVTVAASTAFYPRVVGNLAGDASALGDTNQANAFVPLCIDSAVTIAVASGTAADTWSVEIMYED